MGNLLLIDDDPLVLEALKTSLNGILPKDSQIYELSDPDTVPDLLKRVSVSLILSDIHLHEKDSLSRIAAWKAQANAVLFTLSGDNRPSQVIRAFNEGADGFISKPFDPAEFRSLLHKHFSPKPTAKLAAKKAKTEAPWLVGTSPAITHLREQIARLRGKESLNVMIHGESGTGKERVARALHAQESAEARPGSLSGVRPWVVVNMAALPPTLVESELFGVEKGAFTDAKTSRPGKFELAHGGDLFLDEIGDLPLEAQAKILRIVQQRYVERLGSNQGKEVTVRLISATHRDLEAEIEAKRFREDLYFRLAEVVLTVPPLRDRREDIALLVEDFLAHHPLGENRSFTAAAIDELTEFHWPGNVRELESALKRSLAFSVSAKVDTIEWTPHQKDWRSGKPTTPGPSKTLQGERKHTEQRLVWNAWKKNRESVDHASRELGVSKATFYRRLKEAKVSLSLADD